MSVLYIDITELASWSGKLTGVPRVMNELASRFARDSMQAHFVRWDGQSRAFQAVDFKLYEASSSLPGSKPDGIKEHALLRTAKQIIRKSRILSRTTAAVKMRIASRIHQPRVGADQPCIVPAPSDTLLVLADWHGSDENFIANLKKLKSSEVHIIQVSYDMLPIVTPQYSGHSTATFTHYVENIYPIVDLIITISQSTRRDIESWFKSRGQHAPIIKVIRIGDDFHRIRTEKPQDASFAKLYTQGNGFLLTVGTIEARKNHALLYYMYKLSIARGITLPPLVVVGRRGWLANDIFEIATHDPEVNKIIIFLEDVSDNELAWLYGHCLFTVYPSFYEGWGLPVAESLAYGVPCICSNTSSLPEIAGDLLQYFSPFSPEECLEEIQSLIKEPSSLRDARSTVKAYHPLSWDVSYEDVKQAIKEVIHE